MASSSRRASEAFLLSLAVLVGPAAAAGQETLDTLVAQRADSVDLVVTPTVSAAGSTVTFSYALTSLPTSTQTLFNFRIEVPGEGVMDPEIPAGWKTGFPYRLGTELPAGHKVFGWADISEAESVTPGATVEGFSFESDHLPGPASYWAQGFTPIPTFPSEADFPDVLVGDELYENSVTRQTLGPVVPPGEVATPAPTAAALCDVLALSCAEGWISDPAVCTQLEQALGDVEAALAAGEPGAAGAALHAFEQLVNAGADVTIDQSASSALDLYMDRLRGQGLVPDPGGEGCGPGYWKQSHHFDSWQNHEPSDVFDSAFADALPGNTLEEVLGQGGGGLNSLGRQAVAALLNAEHTGVSYALTATSVVAEFDAAYGEGGGALEEQKDRFEAFNEETCPLD